ncbi:MAG: DNA polymerase IV, partial [Acutalibacteraceae bacterium]|nr:DNA polymerase IV [Acutalibacteraceae bacterium]
MERVILHCDMNNFYASVECVKNESLRDKPVAVAGDVSSRHGIILAKNNIAKSFGVQTAEPIWQAQLKCRDLIIVPPDFDEYLKYSKLARKIYADYTDLIEPYGMDECWLDVTGSIRLLGNGEKIANEIRERVKSELGLTISVGVSFNKIFAKLGSDMKKPDAVTVINKEDFRNKIWHLPASDLLGVGRSAKKTLDSLGIHTIGQLAGTPADVLKYRLGKCGEMIIRYAKGEDTSPVTPMDYEPPVKSVGHGITTKEDLLNNEEVWNVILALSQDIAHRLRACEKCAKGVAIDIRNNQLRHKQWQKQLQFPTKNSLVIAKEAHALFKSSYSWEFPIRSVTVRAINLVHENTPRQIDIFTDWSKIERGERLE